MILCIASVLDPAALATVRAELAGAQFEDGRRTAGWAAQSVKNNVQLSSDSASHAKVTKIAIDAMTSHEIVMAAALPRAFRPPLVSRYETGMSYGRHVDDAVMGSPAMRTDLSFTLFISDPAEYEGGELVLEMPEGDYTYKLDGGSVVLYPSTMLHRVDPVVSGVRSVVVGWIQSLVADPRMREALFDLYRVRRMLFEREGKSDALDLLNKTHSNLLRAFCVP
jgi:PKHD-type hydroxylase